MKKRKSFLRTYLITALVLIIFIGCSSTQEKKEDKIKKNETVGISDDNLVKYASEGDYVSLEQALKQGAKFQGIKNLRGQTLLMIPCSTSDNSEKWINTIKVLISGGVDINEKADVNYITKVVEGYTSLQIAIGFGNLKIVETLINAQADVNLVRNDGLSPLLKACFSTNYFDIKIVQLLVVCGHDSFFLPPFAPKGRIFGTL